MAHIEAFRQGLRELGYVEGKNIVIEWRFAAGVRKLHAIVASSYWTLDNSATLLAGLSVDRIRVGDLDYSLGGELHQTLHRALAALENVLDTQGLSQYLFAPLSDVLNLLSTNEHR